MIRHCYVLLVVLTLSAIKPVEAQTLQPNYGAPATPVSVCSGNATFYAKIIGSAPSCATGTLSITLPPGYVYVSGSAVVTAGSGSVSETSASANQATLDVSGIPNSPDSTVIGFQAYATCAAIGGSTNQVSCTLNTACLPPNTVTSNTFNTQSAALNITSITNKNYSGTAGDIYTRAITITNNGLGTIASLTLADTSGSGMYIYSTTVSGGWGLGVAKSNSGADTVSTFTLSGTPLAQGQSIVVTETVKLVSRCFLQSRFNAYFGCYGNACTANSANGTATAGATMSTAFGNTIKVIPTVSALTCRGTPYTQTIGYTDTGVVAVTNLVLNLFNYNGLSNGYANFRYKTGANGGWSVLTLDSSGVIGATPACVSGMIDTAWATIPVINPGDTVYVAFEEQDCPIAGVNSSVVIAGLGESYYYKNACGESIAPISATLRNYQATQMSVLTTLPSNMSPATAYQFVYTFSVANSKTYTVSGAAGSKVRFSMTLPANVNFSGSVADITLTSISTGSSIGTPSAFAYNPATHIIDFTYSVGGAFSVNNMLNSNLTINNLTLNCAAASTGTTVTLDCFMKINTSCSNEEQFLSQSNTLAFICPSACGPLGGMSFNGFTLQRTNYGLPDNDNNGIPDASGSLDMTKVRTTYTLPGDTVEIGFYGKVNYGPSTPAAGYAYGMAQNTITGAAASRLVDLYASIQLFSAGSTVPFFTSNGLTITGASTTRRVNINYSTLKLLPGFPAGHNKYEDGDSVIVKFYYRTSNFTTSLVAPLTIADTFFISDVNGATGANRHSCGSSYIGNLTLISYIPSSHGSANYTLNGGGTVTLSLDNYLTVGTGTAGSKPFLYEYRPISFYDSLTCNIPTGYSFVSASVAYSYTTGINASSIMTVPISPVNPGSDTLFFDVGQLFENGTLPYGDQGSLITARIILSADCYPVPISHDSLYFNQLQTPGFNNAVSPVVPLPYAVTSNSGTITFTPPALTPTAVTTVASNSDSASWDIQLDISSTTPANYVWLAKDIGPGNATIFNVQQLSGPGGTVVSTISPDAGGIYRLGLFTTSTGYYRVNATYTNCTRDSLQLAYGTICSIGSYPASVTAATSKNDLYLTVITQLPSLQISIVSQPVVAHNFCDTIPYELEILNAGQGTALKPNVQVVLPSTGSIYYIPNTFQFQFPAGSGSYISVPDAQVTLNGDTITFTPPASVLPLLNGLQSYRIKFGMNTSCGFVSGGSLLFIPNGRAYCGQSANGSSQQSQQLQIIGAPATYNAYTLKSKVFTMTRDCGTTGDVLVSYHFKIVNQGPTPTSNSDGYAITLPAPWQLDTTSFTYPVNPAGGGFLNVQGNTWYFSTGAGLAVGDSMQMYAMIRVPEAQVASLVSGSSTPITESAVVRYVGFCSATGQPCPVSQVVLAAKNSTNILYSSSPAYYINAPVLVVTDPPAICHPQTIDLTATSITTGSSAGLGFSYYTDAGGTSALANPSTVSTPGAYYIKGTGVVTGCETNILQVNTSFNFKPTLTTSRDTTVCKDGTAWLGAFSPGSTIQWTGLAAGDTVSVKPPESSFYQVIATNAAGCKDTAAVNVQVDDMTVFLNATPNLTIPGSVIALSTTNNYQVVAWMPTSMFANQTSRTQSITVSDTSILFSVILKSTNGCLDTATAKVIVDPTSFDVYMPNAFTPNGDGKNDVFLAVGPSINEIELRVFNQWGQQIFATQDKTRGWTGLYNGVPQPVGVYIYTVKATLYNKTVITKRGTVLLIR